MTAAPVDGSAKKPPAKTAAAKSKAAAARPRTSTAKTTAEKAAAVKSGEAKAAAAKSATARTAAAKTAAVKSAAARTAASKTAAKTAAAKATTARTAAAKAAAAKAAAVKAATLDESTASTASRTPAAKRTPAKRTPAKTTTAKTTTAKTTPAKKPTPAKSRTTKPREAKPTARPRPAVAADDAAPTGEAIASPIGEIETPAQDAVADDTLFADLLALDPADAESGTGAAIVDPVTDATVVTPVGPESAEAEPEEVMGVELAQERDTETVAAAAAAVAEETTSVPASAPPAVILRDLIKDFGDQRAVNSIDLTVPAGSFYGIVGPNGAGKTTTLSILAGLLRATSGQVVVCGIDQASDALSAKRLMGVLPDRLRTFDRLTGRQLLHYYGLLRGLAAEVIEKRTADLARAFDLADALNRVVSDYSAGMTKKIMLAGAMIHSPRVLVLDEPFEAVDPVSSAVILDILRAYVAHGGTVILSSHGMDLVERVCSRVAIIVGGEVLAEGTIDEVRAGQTLESRFVELSGGVSEVEGLEWLHTFSD